MTALSSFGWGLGLRLAFGTALLACSCQNDSSAVFDDSKLGAPDVGGSATGEAGASASGGSNSNGGDHANTAGGTKATGGASSTSGGKPNGGAAGTASGGKASGGGGKGGSGAGGMSGQAGKAGQGGMGGTGPSGGVGSGGMSGSGGATTPPVPIKLAIHDISDTQVSACLPNQNFGEAVSINVDGDDPCVVQMLINPSMVDIPDGAQIVDATLTLNCTNVGGVVDVSYANTAWAEDAVRWTDKPENGAMLGNFTCDKVGLVTIDLKTALTAWLDGDHKPYGVYFRAETTDGSDFDTSEATDNGVPPVFNVTYTLPAK